MRSSNRDRIQHACFDGGEVAPGFLFQHAEQIDALPGADDVDPRPLALGSCRTHLHQG